MQCKQCKRECLESELRNGVCNECFKKNLSSVKGSDDTPRRNIENAIAQEFKIWALIILIVGIISAVISFAVSENIVIALITLGSFYIIWMALRAIAEIIQLLEDIKNK